MSDEQKIDELMAFDSDSGFVATEADPATPEPPKPAQQDAGSMDQVRSLLVGPLIDDLQMKLTQLGQRLDGSMLELDRRTVDHVSELEKRFLDRLDAMSGEINDLQERHSNVLQEVKDQLETGTRSLNEKMDHLAGKITRERTEEIQAIRTDFEQLSSSITSRLEFESGILRSELVDKNSLSAALSEVALRLSSADDTDADSEIIVADGEPDIDLEAAIDAAAGKI